MSTAALCTVAKKQGKRLSTDDRLKTMWRVCMCYSIHILIQRNVIQPQKKRKKSSHPQQHGPQGHYAL